MPKYRQGDKVRVISDLDTEEMYEMEDGTNSECVTDSMEALRGRVVTITEADERGYRVKENRWHWTDEMFSGLAVQYHVGDRVLVRSDLDDLNHSPAMMALAGTGSHNH